MWFVVIILTIACGIKISKLLQWKLLLHNILCNMCSHYLLDLSTLALICCMPSGLCTYQTNHLTHATYITYTTYFYMKLPYTWFIWQWFEFGSLVNLVKISRLTVCHYRIICTAHMDFFPCSTEISQFNILPVVLFEQITKFLTHK